MCSYAAYNPAQENFESKHFKNRWNRLKEPISS
jgi:hypothetical protein